MKELRERLGELRREDYGDSWPAVREWLRKAQAESDAARARQRPRPREKLLLRPALGAVLLLAAACAIPVPREQTIGHVLRMRTTSSPVQVQRWLTRFPWSGRGMMFATENRTGAPTTVWFAVPRADRREVERWAREAGPPPGGHIEAVEPIRDRVTQPAYAAAAHALFGTSLGGGPSAAEIERRVFGRLSSLAPGSVAIKVDNPSGGGADLYVLPQRTGSATRPIAVHSPQTEELVLMVLRRRPEGSPDTVLVPLDAAAYVGKSERERAEAVENALRARGIDGVEVQFEGGGVWVRTVPPRRPSGPTRR